MTLTVSVNRTKKGSLLMDVRKGPLTDAKIKAAKFEDKNKNWKLTDEKSLYLLITKTGKYFRYNYSFGGKRKTLALGVYPEVSLKEARGLRDDARQLIRQGIDPSEKKKADKARLYEKTNNTFEAIARRWLDSKASGWSEGTSTKMVRILERYIFPCISKRPIADITPEEMDSVLKKIKDMKYGSTANRAMQICGNVFKYARRRKLIRYNPVEDLSTDFPSPPPTHRATTVDPVKIGGLLRAIDGYVGTPQVRYALQLLPLVFLRSSELRHAKWSEIDFDKGQWLIPMEKMKKTKTKEINGHHTVPLSRQAIEILKRIEPITGHGRYVFPNIKTKDRPISDTALLGALRTMGFTGDEITVHGFRGMASTLLNGLGWNSDYIERQLAHVEPNKVRAAYNHAEYLEQRKEMMQAWADHLDKMKSEGEHS